MRAIDVVINGQVVMNRQVLAQILNVDRHIGIKNEYDDTITLFVQMKNKFQIFWVYVDV